MCRHWVSPGPAVSTPVLRYLVADRAAWGSIDGASQSCPGVLNRSGRGRDQWTGIGGKRMAASDKVFAGSIPEIYDRFLVPLIFEPYAVDLAARVAKADPKNVLEIAA